jgi:hypothetical protein
MTQRKGYTAPLAPALTIDSRANPIDVESATSSVLMVEIKDQLRKLGTEREMELCARDRRIRNYLEIAKSANVIAQNTVGNESIIYSPKYV